jgi:dihydroorotate dehydrogenase electron transfer subunit
MSIVAEECLVLSNEPVSSDMHVLVFHSEKIARNIVPGQFVEVSCDPERLLLNRPFSIYDSSQSTLSLLIRRAGKGSNWLNDIQVGKQIKMIGPLGKGFSIGQGRGNLLIGGGCGLASLQLLSKALHQKNEKVDALFGFRKVEDIPIQVIRTFSQTASELITTVEYGSHPKTGNVIDQLQKIPIQLYDRFYCCGPISMLKALVPFLSERCTEVSLEAKMACGLGVCYGCTITTLSGGKRVCFDGPVFEMKEVDWNAM